jgi:2-polyprenyl-3-methyl-5-hydroxy-6-metoxy-1,4-benzoquinol methylase
MLKQKSYKTSRFYDNLMSGTEKRGLLGKDKRFNSEKIIFSKNIDKHYTQIINEYIDENDHVLDYGCGPGAFLVISSALCKNIIGVDISESFIETCKNNIISNNINNAKAYHITPCNTGFENKQFDKIILVDVIHHIEDIEKELDEIKRVLKDDGEIIIFEPNLLNPLMFLIHLIDKNERGLLKVGTPWSYKKLLNKHFFNIMTKYSGLVIGPDSSAFSIITSILNNKYIYPILGWLNPKIFVVATKR